MTTAVRVRLRRRPEGAPASLPLQFTLQPYAGHGGVVRFAFDDDWFVAEFVDGRRYVYSVEVTGADEIAAMARLATLGRGLTTYINRQVRGRYAAQLPAAPRSGLSRSTPPAPPSAPASDPPAPRPRRPAT